jgi:carboxyl-terminal processing protease
MNTLILLTLFFTSSITKEDSLFFWQEVWQKVNEQYVEIDPISYQTAKKIWQEIKIEIEKRPTKKDSILYAKIGQMIVDLPDDYSYFIAPGKLPIASKQDTNSIDAGFRVNIISQNIIVTRVVPSSPADRAGLIVGDTIIKINGRRLVDGLTIWRIEQMLKIKKDEEIVLLVKRSDRILPQIFILHYHQYAFGSFEIQMLEDSILFLKVWNFEKCGLANLRQVLEKISLKPKGIILDLRDNPGGIIAEALILLSCWLEKEQNFCFFNRRGQKFPGLVSIDKPTIFKKIPTVILVNHRTGSAAEIVAGALQDYKLAILIGEKTYGKGTACDVFTLSNGAVLVLTMAYWLTPNGRQIEKIGLQPEIIIEADEDDLNLGKGKQFQKALEILKEMIK